MPDSQSYLGEEASGLPKDSLSSCRCFRQRMTRRTARPMQDKSHSNEAGDGACSRRSKRGRRRPAKPQAAVPADAALTDALHAIPASRNGVVPRARKLARDPGYPSDATLQLIAQLFLSHLELDERSY